VGLLIILTLLFLGIFSYKTHLSKSKSIETKIKEIDSCVYDALLALNIPPGDVIFKTVEPKRDNQDFWVFSEIEILLPTTLSHSNIKNAFIPRIYQHIPNKSARFTSKSQQELILDLFINQRHTHHLVFAKIGKKKPVLSPPSILPRVAIIIDDLGYDKKLASEFLALDGLISFSVLPHSPFQKSIAATIHQSGRDVLVHLPMEPVEYPQVNPGAGALLSSMTPDDLLDQLQKDLDAVPFAVGVNNHMGSRLTQEPEKMRQIFTILKKRNLFFVDSFTTYRSCCQRSARLLKLKFAQRHVFLDHIQNPNAIRFQIKRLISIAKKQGMAIGIAHPYPCTWDVLNKELPTIKNEVEIVRISELVG
jgi:polysaccharide deacetylase 2 family uncharacterized protein YibQ